MVIIFALFLIFLFSFILFLIFFLKKKERGFLFRGMNLALFLVSLPQQLEKEREKEKSLQEYFKKVEQFFSSLSGMVEQNLIKRFFWGNPFFVFEIAVPRIGREIHFYFACPRYLSDLMEKHILGFWPKAQIQPVLDYNIFNPRGKSAGFIVTLTKSPIFPLKFSQEFATDPLAAITSVFTKLTEEGEGAAIQILIRAPKKSSQNKFKKIAENVINSLSQGFSLEGRRLIKERNQTLAGKTPLKTPPQLSPLQQSQISAISQKASQALFEVNLRILTSAPSEARALEILNQFQTAFEQFNSPILNQLKFKRLSGKNLRKLFYRFSFRIFNERETMLLCSGELAGIFHFPLEFISTPYVKWLKVKQVPPPVNLPEKGGIVIGKNVFRGEEKKVCILKEDRRRHLYIVGQTGTGKSVLLQEMMRQDIEAGEGVALIDPHGDLAERMLTLIPPSRIEDVIYFDPADTERPLGLNMLEYDAKFPESKTFVVNELLEIFEKLYNLKAMGFGGPMFEQYMRNALLLVMEDPPSGNTLIEVPRVLSDTNFRKYKLSKCKNIIVKNFWELEAEKAGGEAALANMVPYITSKMNLFIANDLVRPIIAQQESSFNFREIMDKGKILIVNLSKGKLGDLNSYLLGMIIIGKMLIAAFSRIDTPEEERKDFYLYIDEFQNVTTKTITTALAEVRKYRLNLILSHQFIGQLDEETRKAIFGNIGSMLVFRVGPEDAKFLVTEFQPVFDETDLINFDNYNGVLKLLINGETSKPFNIVTFPPSKGNLEIKRLVKEHSRMRYGRPRSMVELETHQRLSQTY